MSQPIKIGAKYNFLQAPSGLQLAIQQVAVQVNASATSGTATVPAGAIVLGYVQNGNQDQFVQSVAIAGTTLTVTLKAAATANNNFKVNLLLA